MGLPSWQRFEVPSTRHKPRSRLIDPANSIVNFAAPPNPSVGSNVNVALIENHNYERGVCTSRCQEGGNDNK